MGMRSVLNWLLPERKRPELPPRTRKEYPTTSIYFKTAMAEFLDNGRGDRPIAQIDPNVFRCGDTLVIMRHWSEKTWDYLASVPEAKVIYFIDDDLWALEDDHGWSADYAEKIRRWKTAFDDHLRGRVSMVVSPSAQVLSHFPDLPTLRLDPALIHRLPPLDHHDDADRRLEVAFCATSSHLPDIEMVCDELAGLLNAHPEIHLTTFFGKRAPENLRLKNCTHHKPQKWADYRRTIETLRFHVGIAPMRDTAFNRGRSCTRMFDHAAFGAAGLYSDMPPFSDRVDHGHDGMLVAVKRGAWADAILELADDRGLCRRLAAHGQETASGMGDPARVRAFWCAQLGL